MPYFHLMNDGLADHGVSVVVAVDVPVVHEQNRRAVENDLRTMS
jgi:hypothetical protein